MEGKIPPVILETRIPEDRALEGLRYGPRVPYPLSPNRSAHYVSHPELPGVWGLAALTPAQDELKGEDQEIVRAIFEELRLHRPLASILPDPPFAGQRGLLHVASDGYLTVLLPDGSTERTPTWVFCTTEENARRAIRDLYPDPVWDLRWEEGQP